jgi:hypothetical protein
MAWFFSSFCSWLLLSYYSCFQLDIATASAENSGVTSVGFVNPVHEASLNETELDSKSVTSDATSGVASAMVDSDDEDDGFFMNSKV